MPRHLALLDRLPGRLGPDRRASRPPVRPRGWFRRHLWLFATPAALILAVGLVWWHPWSHQPCGLGMRPVGSPYVCVGLDLDSSALQAGDRLADLEGIIARHDARTSGDFRTIVLLEDLTPNPAVDIGSLSAARHDIEGGITATWPDDKPDGIKLLLANVGSNAAYWRQTVNEIIKWSKRERIIAVTDLGQSLDNTRNAVAALSNAGIAAVGSAVTADDMNKGTDNVRAKFFFRVGPTNSDEANAAASYIAAGRYRHIMLVKDLNASDSYAATLTGAFLRQSRVPIQFTQEYYSPESALIGTNKEQYLESVFGGEHDTICDERPDLIYFTGRGVDLRSFVAALSAGGACLLHSVTVMTGDDASRLIGSHLALSGDIGVKLLYTALAYPNEWGIGNSIDQRNYTDFARQFTDIYRFPPRDLADSGAIMEHDAVLTVITAALEDPSTSPSSIANFLFNFNCHFAIPGASGLIAFQPDTGNQIDKAMPILEFNTDGSVRQAGLAWYQGHPLNTSPSCSS